MNLNINEFIEEQRKGRTELLANLSKSRVAAARSAARESAVRIKALNGRVRAMARSGVRLTAVSHGAVRSLVELNADIVSAALTDAAVQLERRLRAPPHRRRTPGPLTLTIGVPQSRASSIPAAVRRSSPTSSPSSA